LLKGDLFSVTFGENQSLHVKLVENVNNGYYAKQTADTCTVIVL